MAAGRFFYVATLGALSALTAIAIDISLPGQPQIASALGAHPEAGAVLVSGYFFGFAIGQLIWGPLSDRFGRLAPLYVGMSGFLAASLVCALATSFELLTWARVVQGAFGGAGPVIARALARDEGGGARTTALLSTMSIAVGAGPLLAPPLGSALIAVFGWRSPFWFLVAFSLLLLLGMALFLSTAGRAEGEARPRASLRAALPLLLRSEVLVPTIIASAIYFGYGAFLAISAAAIFDRYHLGATPFGLLFSIAAAAFVLGSMAARQLTRLSRDFMISAGCVIAAAAGVGLIAQPPAGAPLAVFWALVTTYVLAFGIIAPLTTAKALEPAGEAAGAISSLIGTITMLAGAFGSDLAGRKLFADPTEALSMLMALSALSCLAVQLIAILVAAAHRRSAPA
ncbi:MAG: bcr1 [Alphaproteobacteria bacterium]|nr:bcr1 [Alphaproteobacteria bacterium]